MTPSNRSRQVLFSLFALLLAMSPALAEEPQRTWQDKSGKFEVEAKLLEQTDGKVQLLKADGLVIEVPIAALSEGDQKYLRELAPVNPFAGGVPREAPARREAPGRNVPAGMGLLAPEARARELPSNGRAIFVENDVPVYALEADPAPVPVKFKPLLQPLEKLDAYARISPPIVIDPAVPVFAVSVQRVGNTVNPANFGRIYLVNGEKRTPEVALNLESTLVLFDHHAASGRSLAVLGVDSPSQRGGDLVLLDQLASGTPRAIARWHLPNWEKRGFKPKVEAARLLDGQRALVQVNNTVYVWDLIKGNVIYQIDRVQSGAKLELSGTNKYLALPTGAGCRLIDLAQGELIGKVPFSHSLTPEVKFSPDGKQLALVAGNQFVVWDLQQAEIVADATFADPAGAFYGWVGNEYLFTQLAGLLKPELGMPLWRYSVSTGTRPLTMPGGVVVIEKNLNATLLVCLPVPHDPVASVAQRLASGNADLTLLRQGTEVALRVEAIEGVDRETILAGLKVAVERAGWKVSDAAPIEVVATIGRGEQEHLAYRQLGGSRRDPIGTVAMTPYTAGLQILHGGSVVWERTSRNMVPSILRLEQGQTVEQAVKQFEKPDPEYIERLRLPPNILRPEVLKTIGTSAIREGRWNDFFPR